MDFLRLNTSKTFIIAEIGQNHQGNIETAKKLISVAKDCGADCVKFQKTDLEEKFTKSALSAPYASANAWGATYGEHKAYLELSEEQFIELQDYARKVGIYFTASAMDGKSLEFLKEIKVPFIKIGSGDSNNPILIENAAKMNVPLVISTGMNNLAQVKKIYDLVSKYHKEFALLHCVSSYPTPYEDIHLNVLTQYNKEFPDIPIGYSGHELGTHISVASVALGANIIERHITLDKTQKGSDHQSSLDPNELKSLVKQIRSLEIALGDCKKAMQPSEQSCYKKLGKSLVYAKNMEKGHVIGREDLKIKVCVPKGLDGWKYECLIGKELVCEVESDDPVYETHFV